MDAINKCKEETYFFVRKRASLKAKITITIKKLKMLEQENRLAYSFFKNNYENIVKLLDQIKIIDANILEVFHKYNMETIDPLYILGMKLKVR